MEEIIPESKTILIVDDEETVCDFFQAVFAREGFRVICVTNGKSAVDRLKSKTYRIDLLILDLMMPGYSGYDVLKELQHPDFKDIPIFINTARALDQGTIEMIKLESNVRGYWQKPVDIIDMVKKAHEVLGTTPRQKPSF